MDEALTEMLMPFSFFDRNGDKKGIDQWKRRCILFPFVLYLFKIEKGLKILNDKIERWLTCVDLCFSYPHTGAIKRQMNNPNGIFLRADRNQHRVAKRQDKDDLCCQYEL